MQQAFSGFSEHAQLHHKRLPLEKKKNKKIIIKLLNWVGALTLACIAGSMFMIKQLK